MKLLRRRFLLTAATALAVAGTVGGGTSGNAYVPSVPDWVGTWSATPTAAGAGSSGAGFTDQSVRMIVHTSVGGDAVRIRLSDAFGDRPLSVGHATVALPNTATPELTDVDPASVHDLTFNGGSTTVTVPKGAQVLSDPLTMTVGALQDLVVTIYLPAATGPATWHWTARAQSFVGTGDLAGSADGTGFGTVRTSWYFLAGVDVRNYKLPRSIVVLGDSVTDGNGSTINANHRWTDDLAKRLVQRPYALRDFAVLNQGAAGNAVNHDGIEIGFNELGVNGLARLQRDVFSQTGVRTAVVELGINDIQAYNDSADNIIAGLKQIVAQCHEQDIEVVLATITPFEGYRSWTADKEATRQAVNAWIRGASGLDGVIDFDAVVRDPAQPTKLRADWDSGDHIHPNDTGYQAMADAVSLNTLIL